MALAQNLIKSAETAERTSLALAPESHCKKHFRHLGAHVVSIYGSCGHSAVSAGQRGLGTTLQQQVPPSPQSRGRAVRLLGRQRSTVPAHTAISTHVGTSRTSWELLRCRSGTPSPGKTAGHSLAAGMAAVASGARVGLHRRRGGAGRARRQRPTLCAPPLSPRGGGRERDLRVYEELTYLNEELIIK